MFNYDYHDVDKVYIAYTRLAVNEFYIDKIGKNYDDIEGSLVLGSSVYIGSLVKFIKLYAPRNINQFI